MVEIDSAILKGAFALLTWYLFNIFTVILNKYMYQMFDFTFPFTLTAVHMFICSIGGFLALRVFKVVPMTIIDRQKYISNILPLGVIFCFNIILGNVSLRWIPVSFMQTIKSSVPAFTVFIQVFFLKQQFSEMTYYSLIPVVGGVALASATEVNFQFFGFLTAVIASVTTAIQSIVSGVLLTGSLRLDSVNMVYYMAPVSFLIIIPMALFNEWEGLQNYPWEMYGQSRVFAYLFVSGLVAFLLNISVFFAIKSTSPLTFTVFGNLKVVVVIIISVMIFQNEVTIWNGIGCFIAIGGILFYNYVEYQVKEAKKRAAMKSTEYRSDKDILLDVHTDSGEDKKKADN